MHARDDYERGALDALGVLMRELAIHEGAVGPSRRLAVRAGIYRHCVEMMIAARRDILRAAEDAGAEEVA